MRIQSYEIIEQVGIGGMGIVYKAKHIFRDEIAAFKSLSPQFAQDQNIRERFKNEAIILKKLNHKNIVRVTDFIEENNGLHLVMEFVEGKTLDRIIGKEVGPIPYQKALSIFNQILAGISYAHENGVVHRDIKPGNIIVTAKNEVKIIDFGIAKIQGNSGLTKKGTKMGTIYYMSPEQIRGEQVDEQSDIYSLGITLYEMLAGRLPFDKDNQTSELNLMNKIVNEPLPDPRDFYPSIPEWLVNIVKRATAKNKENRIKNCGEFISVLTPKPEPVPEPVKQHIVKSPTPKPVAVSSFSTVQIGDQIWMKENLNVDRFRNGDIIPEAKTDEDWKRAGEEGKPAWCYYNNNSENGEKYGKLYNWYAVNDARGLSPVGWHIPTEEEFEKLKSAVNDNSNGLKSVGQGTGKGAGTNASSFSALLAGHRYSSGYFGDLGYDSNFWSSTEYGSSGADYLDLYYNGSSINLRSTGKGYGFSVRCVNDKESEQSSRQTKPEYTTPKAKITKAPQQFTKVETSKPIVNKGSTAIKLFVILLLLIIISLIVRYQIKKTGEPTEQEPVILEETVTNKTVAIGNQIWMTENLNVDRFRNGDIIPEAKTDEDWKRAGEEGKPAWCNYNNNPENGKWYGKLYNWYAVNDPRGLAPEGWHIPTKEELKTIEHEFNRNGNSLKEVGEGTGDGVGTNTSGFSALLAGSRYSDGYFNDLGDYAYFWSSTEGSSDYASRLNLYSGDSNIYLGYGNKDYGFSVRCVKDEKK